MRLLNFTIFCLFIFQTFSLAQNENLTNAEVVEMSNAGLSKELIIDKINNSNADFDVSVKALVELKKANVSDEIISAMVEKSKAKRQRFTTSEEKVLTNQVSTQNQPNTTNYGNPQTPAEMLKNAKTIAIKKDSIHPARQNLEKALLKRSDWKNLNLSITEYKETADLYIQIGRIPMTWVTHRYVFRVFDTRSGTLICAGETTSWGSLSENLAGEIVKELVKAQDSK